MDSRGKFMEDENLNEGMSYLSLSGSNDFSNDINNCDSGGHANESGINGDLSANMAPGIERGTNYKLNEGDPSDDEVMFVGSSITVKTEKEAKEPLSDEAYDAVVDKSGGDQDGFKGDHADSAGNKSGWLISNFKRAPRAHYVQNANSIRKGSNKGSLELLDNIIDIKDLSKVSSQCSTVSNNTSYTYPSSYHFNCGDGRRSRRRRSSLRQYATPAPCNYPLNYCDDIMYSNGGNKGFLRFFNPERINSWMKTIFNVTKTIILIYVVVSIFLIVKRDIETHIQRNVKTVDNESLTCLNEYKRNKCGVLEIPALVDQCREWEICMKKDSLNYENISLISASVIASSIKHFISQLDLKSLLFILFIFLLILYRNRPRQISHPSGTYYVDGSNGYSQRLNRYFVPNYMNKSIYPYANNN
ncbi:conserved hypothetical protein [Theileria orientalis strain Shintoku]|uniref:Brl1/Brr6 domain-containing protein n=1 Tax=Theileria orientalis strain Shintoku TaxID=869250 RepID=J4C3J3_THEOR|nr:conserved hypothetical protein [Theileria orientalis strain Shintoku]BAM40541.1 conserved hypothetical protein [Theileria orientalis strain Shintoku]|eukprot:XP_009690842.1 conserved hypothetical protein [Theileria orientalis strain Shintoku]